MKTRIASESYRRKLDSDFILANQQDDEIQALMARFLCIRIGGYIEVFLKERIQRFVDNRKSHKIISEYIQNAVRNITNLNSDKIETILRSFSNDWADYYKSNVNEEIKSSLGSIYTIRNSVAHGGNDSLSLLNLKRHFANVDLALDIVDRAITKCK